jgi:cytochrome c biogenesis protein ResB
MKIPNQILKRVWNFLARMDVASVLITLVLLLAAFGSFFPQWTPELSLDPDRRALWREGIRNRYGRAAELLIGMGVFKLFQTPLFITSFALLVVSTLVCILHRWKAVWRRVFNQEVRCPDTLFENLKHKCEFILKGSNDILVFQDLLSASGFRVRSTMIGDTHHFRAERYRYSPLGRLVSHLGTVLLLLGVVISSACSWRGGVMVEPGGDVQLPSIGWHIFNEGFEVERYRDGSVADYVASVRVTHHGEEIARGQVRLNDPLNVHHRAVYLTGFVPTGSGVAVNLMVVRDPGYDLVIAACFLVLLGMTVSFNFPNCCIFARFMADGTLRFVGRAERRACDFDDEFRTLETELAEKMAKGKHGY